MQTLPFPFTASPSLAFGAFPFVCGTFRAPIESPSCPCPCVGNSAGERPSERILGGIALFGLFVCIPPERNIARPLAACAAPNNPRMIVPMVPSNLSKASTKILCFQNAEASNTSETSTKSTENPNPCQRGLDGSPCSSLFILHRKSRCSFLFKDSDVSCFCISCRPCFFGQSSPCALVTGCCTSSDCTRDP